MGKKIKTQSGTRDILAAFLAFRRFALCRFQYNDPIRVTRSLQGLDSLGSCDLQRDIWRRRAAGEKLECARDLESKEMDDSGWQEVQ